MKRRDRTSSPLGPRLTFAVALSAGLLFSATAFADEIGRVEVNGRTVILNDDQTWSYASDAPVAPTACTDVGSEVLPVVLCLNEAEWGFANLGGEAEHKLKRKGAELYLMVITEKAEISIPNLKKAAITNAQNASGLTKVKTLLDGSAIIDGKGFGQINYQTIVDGIDVSYANYGTMFPGKGSLQIVFFAASNEFDSFKPEISKVLSATRITE